MRVCLVTTGQPSTNPRLVKEADALVEAGHQVHVVAAHWADWAVDLDRQLLAQRQWRVSLIDWRRETAPGLFTRSRARHWLARHGFARPIFAGRMAAAALSRVGPELRAAATAVPAELYIAHNLGALPAACAAADVHRAAVGFDAEDFHSGQINEADDARLAVFTREVERRFVSRCSYVTAAAPGIAAAYRDLCNIRLPTCILNVFPLSERPRCFRPDPPDGPVRLYWFSQSIGPGRGLDDAVRAMGMLTEYGIELHLRGCWQPGYENDLRRLAAESGVDQERIVSHEPAHPADMTRLAAQYSVGLALEPGTTENSDLALSNKVFAYLLGGAALLATRTRGQSLLASELGNAAAWCDAGNHESLAAALKNWLDHREALAAARATAWQLGERTFNWDREKPKFVGEVSRVLEIDTARVPADVLV